MSKTSAAEWILSLATTRERAATTVGDLLERDSQRVPLRFWSDVLRTTASLLYKDLASDPRWMAGLAIRAWLISVLFLLLTTVLVFMGTVVVLTLVAIFGPARTTAPVWASSLGAWWLIGVVPMLAGEFQTGKWLARRAPGREIPAWIALAVCRSITGTLATIGISLALRYDLSLLELLGLTASQAPFLLLQLPSLAGALSMRNRAPNPA